MTVLLRIRTLAVVLFLVSAFALHAQVKPALIGPLTAGTKTIQGIGDPGTSTTFNLCIRTTNTAIPTDCTPPSTDPVAATFIGSIAPSPTTQFFSVTLNSALTAGSFVYLEQKVGAAAPTYSPVLEVVAAGATNEREQTEFVGGTLLSANGANYSQASLFLALNYDRTLWRPGWYSHKDMACIQPAAGKPIRPVTAAQMMQARVLCPATRNPGLNTFFQARLTTIPVNASTNTTTTSSSGTTTPTGTSVSSFLAAQKTAQFDGGIFAPFLFGKVPSNKEKTAAFYIAPIARFGFSTPTGSPSGSSSTATTGGSTTTTTTTTLGTANTASGQLYNYGLAGLRIATADLNPGSIHTSHYFDVGIGKYSNLQSLVCKSGPPATSCLNATTGKFDPSVESRSTLFRLEFEGFLEIISANNSSLILGISANTGPGFLDHRANLDTNNRAAEDIEFLIGYKFDISQLLGGISIIGKNP